MEEKQLGFKEFDKIMSSEFIIPPLKEWETVGGVSGNDGVEAIAQIRQKYRDPLLMEIYESGRIIHAGLANRLSVSVSGLNAIIKKMNEVPIKPIRETKAGKFKFYTLTGDGKKYVESTLLPSVISNRRDSEEVHNLFLLLAMYKDQHQDAWCKNLKIFLEKESESADTADDVNKSDEYELLQAFGQFYHRENSKAGKLLELSVADKELRQCIVLYFNNKYINNDCVWSVLNQWEQQDTFEVYKMIDELFRSIDEEGRIVEKSMFCLTDIDLYFDVVLNKIQADILQAAFRQWSKDRILSTWLETDMEKHLALYLAEKYQTLFERLQQKMKNCE